MLSFMHSSLRKPIAFVALHLALLGSVVCAEFEITADAMRGIEDTTKSLDSNVALKDAKALDEARELVAFFSEVEGYYAKKGDAADAVAFAKKTHQIAAQVHAAVKANNYDQAGDAVGALVKSCKTCHEVYKSK